MQKNCAQNTIKLFDETVYNYHIKVIPMTSRPRLKSHCVDREILPGCKANMKATIVARDQTQTYLDGERQRIFRVRSGRTETRRSVSRKICRLRRPQSIFKNIVALVSVMNRSHFGYSYSFDCSFDQRVWILREILPVNKVFSIGSTCNRRRRCVSPCVQ